MKELRELEELIVAEVSSKKGQPVSTMDPSVIGQTIGTLYAIVLGNQKTLDELNRVIEGKKK